jgi:aminopeptidase N
MPDWRRDVYEKVGPISSYLLALAVSDFTSVEADNELWDGRPVTIWAPPPL